MLLLILISHSISLKVYAEEIKGAENEIVQLMFRASNLDKKVYWVVDILLINYTAYIINYSHWRGAWNKAISDFWKTLM